MQHTTNISEQTVIKACAGDNGARIQLYNLYSRAMYNICIRMTGNEDDAADVLQDAFIHAFNHLGQLKQLHAFGGWLKKIVVNQCISFCRKSIHWSQLEEGETYSIAEEETEWWVRIPLELVHQEIKDLPSGCRLVFVLFAMEGFGHKEVAGQLGISESTSKSQYQRARKLLQERIIKQMNIHG